ncbi:hypothetical protein DUNSADRAFT_1439 [Dunaliella salina]|uniref:Uncharacterized protein n=1 Tax=Dunaliella salina TaxID=3046 RepID=A0ABQ7FXG0_DUNSA|nr:hypothetical protein DUNSADRAFT_1439 [Dunaliella salina]|eukprot:KAF5827044.1 hypothetical protein DUNSADRAFT_1439 [Dunaliella salina]
MEVAQQPGHAAAIENLLGSKEAPLVSLPARQVSTAANSQQCEEGEQQLLDAAGSAGVGSSTTHVGDSAGAAQPKVAAAAATAAATALSLCSGGACSAAHGQDGGCQDEEVEQPSHQQAAAGVSLSQLMQAVKEEASGLSSAVAVGAGDSSASLIRQLAQIEQRVLRSFCGGGSGPVQGGFPALTADACPSLLALLDDQPLFAAELQSLLLADNVPELGLGTGANAARHGVVRSPLLSSMAQQAERAWHHHHWRQQQQQQQDGESSGSYQTRVAEEQRAMEADVTASLCAQFGVQCIEELGCASVRQLLDDLEHTTQHGRVVATCALTCGVGSFLPSQPSIMLGLGDDEEMLYAAWRVLSSAPALADIGEW